MTTGPASPRLDLGATLRRSLPGRLVLVASGLLALLLVAGLFGDLPFAFDFVRRVVWICWLVGMAWLAGALAVGNWRVLLWRVRRKLLLSYVFLGFVPVALVLAFGLVASVLLYVTVAKYVFLETYLDAVQVVRNLARVSAADAESTPALAQAGLARHYAGLNDRFPALSIAIVPIGATSPDAATVSVAGPWAHAAVPREVPGWMAARGEFASTVVAPGTDGRAAQLVIRAAVPTRDRRRVALVDLPVDGTFAARLRDDSGITMGPFSVTGCEAAAPDPALLTDGTWTLFEETVAFIDCTGWRDGVDGRVSITLVAPVRDLYDRLAAFNLSPDAAPLASWAAVLLQLLWLIGVLFLIIQGSAIVMGALLARSITSAIHELFEGTERVRQGDFAHRIRIESRDQLGELAGSFNRMSASIEHLLHVQREKQRLDDELRIARQIQKSLLPARPPVVADLDIADLCEPAREVGGDYYDFFTLGPRLLGVMIADVSGKGTSAALYMAELKGIMLALSRTSRSPRAVLIEANRLLAGHLDNRSFITMAYAVIDLASRRVTVARAGHAPILRIAAGRSELVAPAGVVLGLRLPGSEALFEQVLAEQEFPLVAGDLIVLYTDGITEATNAAGDLFGDEALARVVAAHHDLGAAGVRERVVREVAAFVGGAEAHDDMTMVVIGVREGTPASDV